MDSDRCPFEFGWHGQAKPGNVVQEGLGFIVPGAGRGLRATGGALAMRGDESGDATGDGEVGGRTEEGQRMHADGGMTAARSATNIGDGELTSQSEEQATEEEEQVTEDREEIDGCVAAQSVCTMPNVHVIIISQASGGT